MCNNLKQNTHAELGKWLYKYLPISLDFLHRIFTISPPPPHQILDLFSMKS